MLNMLKKLTLLFLLVTFSATLFAAEKTEKKSRFAERKDVERFINDMYVKHQFSAWDLKLLFKTITPDPKVIQAISKPFEDVSWEKYKARIVTDERAKAGAEFWRQNAAILQKAESEFGVPAEIIVAIIGVETRYGRNTGKFPVLQTLATLAFDYPQRGTFFKGELEQFLLLMREEKRDPKSVYGSYAGAIGIPQFIPSSYRRYAVSFSGNGQRDLNNVLDAIGSVANYFKEHGWKTGEPVLYAANVYGSEYQRLASTNPVPKLTLTEYSQFNIRPKDENVLKSQGKRTASFIMLNKDSETPEHWLTLNNFYVITRYNHSVNYAMAVYELSQMIRKSYYEQEKS